MPPQSDDLRQWIPRLADHSVLVVGDLFLDEYLFGQATRLSREAPVPVLEFTRRTIVPGGAANPAQNVCALLSHATACGVVGTDTAAGQLRAELDRARVSTAGIVADASRPTTVKTRLVAERSLRFPQQLARLDRVQRQEVAGQVEAELTARLQSLIPLVDAVLVSDYQSGAASRNVVQQALKIAREHGKLCTADAQGAFDKYCGLDLIKANRQEVEVGLNCRLDDQAAILACGHRLMNATDANVAVITLGSQGLSVIARNGDYQHIAAANRTEVYDVTGAGDTVIAVMTLALLAGAPVVAAARLANHAAGLVVRKLGNAVVTPEELTWAVTNGQ